MNDIELFIESFIPLGIDKKKRAELRSELTSHLLDTADCYVELGYTYEESIEKAKERMGKDEKMQDKVREDFNELYHEKTVWAVFAGLFVVLLEAGLTALFFLANAFTLSYIKLYFDWVFPISAIAVFAVLALLYYAKTKGYNKTLLAMGIAFCIVHRSIYAGTVIMYIRDIFLCLLDKYTSICFLSIDDLLRRINIEIYIFPLLCILYCFIWSYRIKRGKSKPAFKKRAIIICTSAFLSVIVATGFVYTKATGYLNYSRNYILPPLNVTDGSERAFEELKDVGSYDEAKNIAESNGFYALSEYEKTLRKQERKVFDYKVKDYELKERNDVEIYFMPYERSFLYIGRGKNGEVTFCGIGDCRKDSVDRVSCWLYGDYESSKHIFDSTEIGDDRDKVIESYKNEDCKIYGDFIKLSEDGREETVRINGYKDCEIDFGDSDERRCFYIELVFVDGKYVSGVFDGEDF